MPEPLHRAVVTGASGFVGRALCAQLAASVQAVSMSASDWRARIAATDLVGAVVFHLAARVHEAGPADERAYLEDNSAKTRELAQAAAREGARRFVFLSTIKVNGEETPARAFTPDDEPAPRDAYGRSKLAAERALAEVARAAALPYTIVRSPLVYGPGARGNLRSLVRLADTPWPLPFAALRAPRSFVHVDDLARALIAAASHERAPGRTYLVAHRDPACMADVMGLLRSALGRPPRLWRTSPALLEKSAAILGQGERMRRLTRPLVADPSAAERELEWVAQVPMARAVEELARDHRARSGT